MAPVAVLTEMLGPKKSFTPGTCFRRGGTGVYSRILNESPMPSQCHPSEFTYIPSQIANVRAALSADRFCSYLAAAHGDERVAIRHYEHNTALSEALYSVLQGFEVALRNSIHHTMIRETGKENWFDHFGLNSAELESIQRAKEKITKKAKSVMPSRIVAELTFGFWVALAARHYDARLWVPHLRKAFPRKNLGRRAAFERLSGSEY